MNLENNMFERIPERLDVYKSIVSGAVAECILSETGSVPNNRACNSQFDCLNCAFEIDALGRDETYSYKINNFGVSFCSNRFYHHCHTWAQVEENGFIRVGIDDFGQNILGPVEKIFFPLKDERISAKSIQVKARGQIFQLLSPVDGYVEQVNEKLRKDLKLINQSPYEKGWLILLRPTGLVENLKKLFFGSAAEQWFDLEMYRLAALITSEKNLSVGQKLNMRLPDGSLPGFATLNDLPSTITRRVLEQYFLYCHTNDKFKG